MKSLLVKIKASALQFAIFVSVIVALLLASFLLLNHTYSSFRIQSDETLENIKRANEGIAYFFSPDNRISDSLEILLNDIPVTLKSSFWGSYEKVSARGGKGSKAFSKTALLGSNSQEDITALYLEDNELPLVLVGNSRIEGVSYLPENIVKPGSIGGEYYHGEKLIHGERLSSKNSLPSLKISWRKYVEQMLDFIPAKKDKMVGLGDINNSFFDEPSIVFQQSRIFIDQVIRGNVIIKSEKEIQISSMADLDQVLLIAPKVVIEDDFEGNLHVIAEKVIVGKNAKLSYPSSLVVVGESRRNTGEIITSEPSVLIGFESSFQGNILYLNPKESETRKSDLLIEDDVIIEGAIYCEGYAEMRGELLGSFYSRFFVASGSGSLYINHIQNGQILTENVEPKFCGLLLEGKEKKVAAWLY